MISINLNAECPYCENRQEREFLISSEVDGHFVMTCENCEKRFLIRWFLFADSEVQKIESVSPPVRCSAQLESYEGGEDWSDDDDDGSTVEA
jgi:hypothetical protein